MKLANGVGTVYKLSGNRRNPYIVRKTVGWDIDTKTGKRKQQYITIGYAPTRAKGLEMLMDYNKNPYDIEASKITFAEVFEKWSAEKFPTISDSNAKAYKASYNTCEPLHDRVFKDLKLTDLQGVVDNCGKNYPTLRKLKVLFSQMYEYAMKYEICMKDYSEYVDIIKFKDKNPNKTDRSPFSKEEIEAIKNFKEDFSEQGISVAKRRLDKQIFPVHLHVATKKAEERRHKISDMKCRNEFLDFINIFYIRQNSHDVANLFQPNARLDCMAKNMKQHAAQSHLFGRNHNRLRLAVCSLKIYRLIHFLPTVEKHLGASVQSAQPEKFGARM